MRFTAVVAAALAAALAAPFATARLGAQAPASRVRVPIPTQTYIGFNPLGLPANVFTLELENAVSSGITVGAVGSYIDFDDKRFTTADFKVRYYPSEAVLRGFAIGISAGATRYSKVVTATRQSLSAPTAGILLDYNWLLGRSERFLVGTGIGAKRILASESERQRVRVDYATVTTRLILGFAF
ncbi:MAG TPA: hypothetical protein VGQ44_12105 [Gemmatimonadaceae bacterium]|jgi:hypothetical protein|nr:hypothetical protein [Gemmatimonadaceae bacterium]